MDVLRFLIIVDVIIHVILDSLTNEGWADGVKFSEVIKVDHDGVEVVNDGLEHIRVSCAIDHFEYGQP